MDATLQQQPHEQQQQDHDDKASSNNRNIVALLTLRRHRDGIWITRLVDALRAAVHDNHDTATTNNNTSHQSMKNDDLKLMVQVVCLEDWLHGWVLTTAPPPNRWKILVNRVSDAASPAEVKATAGLLQAAKTVWKVPCVWNGPEAYQLATNKWCHHVLFQQAGLLSPATILMTSSGNDTDQLATRQTLPQGVAQLQQQQQLLVETHGNHDDPASSFYDYLIKPNAGGFGAGIELRRMRTTPTERDNTTTATESDNLPPPSFADGVYLLQDYVPTRTVYRVWFLCGRVQCARQTTMDSFTGGCACSNTTTRPWTVPPDVRAEVEDQLLTRVPDDCHCGSVEFLVLDHNNNNNTTNTHYDDNHPGDASQRRWYVDWNLLSTLPVDNDPAWTALAQSILASEA